MAPWGQQSERRLARASHKPIDIIVPENWIEAILVDNLKNENELKNEHHVKIRYFVMSQLGDALTTAPRANFREEKASPMKKWGHRQYWDAHFWRHYNLILYFLK